MADGMSYEDAYKQVTLDTIGDLAYDALGGAISGAGHAVMAGGVARMRENDATDILSKELQQSGYTQEEAAKLADAAVQNAVGYTTTDEQKALLEDKKNKAAVRKAIETQQAENRKAVVESIIEREAKKTGVKLTGEEQSALAGIYEYETNKTDGKGYSGAVVEAFKLGKSEKYIFEMVPDLYVDNVYWIETKKDFDARQDDPYNSDDEENEDED